MKLVHSAATPWRPVSKGLELFYLKCNNTIAFDVQEINSKVAQHNPLSIIDLQHSLHVTHNGVILS